LEDDLVGGKKSEEGSLVIFVRFLLNEGDGPAGSGEAPCEEPALGRLAGSGEAFNGDVAERDVMPKRRWCFP